jgi:hypothetical protein
MSVSGGNGLADYCFEEEDYSLVDQVEDQDQEKEEELHHPQQEDHRNFHMVPSAFRDSSDRNINIEQHDITLSNSSRRSRREKKPISFEVRMICNLL